MEQSNQAPVMFYDGECGLCAASVQWCLKRDKRGVLLFAPIQGASYARVLNPNKPTNISSMVICEGDRMYIKSGAALRMLQLLGGFWTVVGYIGMACPRFMRDAAYDFVAKRRLSWFGKADQCPIPQPMHRARFID